MFKTVCDGIVLRGELFLPERNQGTTVVPLCHGIPRAGPRRGDPGYMPVAERLTREGYGALIFNFRGCGVSDGDFDLLGWGRDLVAVTRTLREIPGVEKIVPWGFSGGAAATVWAATNGGEIDAAALFACPADFTALKKVPVAEGLAEYFRGVGIIRDPGFPPDPAKWLEGFGKIDPEAHVAKISPRPLMILHGTNDETVPVEHAYRLHDAAGEPKTLKIVDGAPHRLRESREALEAAFGWLERTAR